MKSFKATIYLHRNTEENQELVKIAKNMGFGTNAIANIKYMAYEVPVYIEIFEDGTIKVLEPIEL